MRRTILVGASLVVAALAVSTFAAPSRRFALVNFTRPTYIAGAAVLGTVVFKHDDARMALGEPCTTVYFYDAKKKDLGKMIVEFMCVPQERRPIEKFEATCVKANLSGPDMLVEYQFAGEHEGHGVPR